MAAISLELLCVSLKAPKEITILCYADQEIEVIENHLRIYGNLQEPLSIQDTAGIFSISATYVIEKTAKRGSKNLNMLCPEWPQPHEYGIILPRGQGSINITLFSSAKVISAM